MDENNKIENNEEQKHICFKNHCWKMCLGMIVAAFIGGFLATYFVADQVIERCHRDHFIKHHDYDDFGKNFEYNMKYMDKVIKKQDRERKKMERNFLAADTMFVLEPVKITSFFDDSSFNIEVSLKLFNGDENKINYNISGSKLTVYGKSELKNNKREEEISFSHDFILPDNADTMSIKKEKAGDTLIISVPLKESLKD